MFSSPVVMHPDSWWHKGYFRSVRFFFRSKQLSDLEHSLIHSSVLYITIWSAERKLPALFGMYLNNSLSYWNFFLIYYSTYKSYL